MTNIAGRLVLAAVLCAVSSSVVQAGEVYKCLVDGKTVYAERPCRPGDAPVRLRNDAPVTDRERTAADLVAAKEKLMALRLDVQRSEEQRRIDAASEAYRAELQNAKDRCAALLRASQDADNESRLYRYHQGLIDDAARRKKEAQDRHFSECFVRGM